MEKFKGQIWVRDTRESASNPAGGARRFRVPPELVRMLGQGSKLHFHGRIYSLDANAQVTFTVWTGCLGKEHPADSGIAVNLDSGALTNQPSIVVNTVGPFEFSTNPPPATESLMADVEIVAEVSDATASAVVRIEFELWCTVISS